MHRVVPWRVAGVVCAKEVLVVALGKLRESIGHIQILALGGMNAGERPLLYDVLRLGQEVIGGRIVRAVRGEGRVVLHAAHNGGVGAVRDRVQLVAPCPVAVHPRAAL
jgi:hypothetical protein